MSLINDILWNHEFTQFWPDGDTNTDSDEINAAEKEIKKAVEDMLVLALRKEEIELISVNIEQLVGRL